MRQRAVLKPGVITLRIPRDDHVIENGKVDDPSGAHELLGSGVLGTWMRVAR
jgi:hypothetical protein